MNSLERHLLELGARLALELIRLGKIKEAVRNSNETLEQLKGTISDESLRTLGAFNFEALSNTNDVEGLVREVMATIEEMIRDDKDRS